MLTWDCTCSLSFPNPPGRSGMVEKLLPHPPQRFSFVPSPSLFAIILRWNMPLITGVGLLQVALDIVRNTCPAPDDMMTRPESSGQVETKMLNLSPGSNLCLQKLSPRDPDKRCQRIQRWWQEADAEPPAGILAQPQPASLWLESWEHLI